MSSPAWFLLGSVLGAAFGFFVAAILAAASPPTIAPPELHGERRSTLEIL
jgi:hypothetical protein